MNKAILAILLAAGATASGQTTTWNGHTYEVIQYKDVWGEDPKPSFQWWGGGHSPYDHAPTLGGHVVTITSAEEEEAIRGMWAQMPTPAVYYTICASMTLDRTVEPWVVTWSTGEVSTYRPEVFPTDPDCYHFTLGGFPMYLDIGCDQFLVDGAAFYILEIDPPTSPKDSDGDGLTNDEEKNTRHSYFFIQAAEPIAGGGFRDGVWVPVSGGWTRESATADAAARGGHLLQVDDMDEWVAINHMGPWPVGTASTHWNDVPILESSFRLGNLVRGGGGSAPYITGTTDTQPHFTTYVLEIEDSTDPNNPDTDADGLSDGQEVLTYHTNPILQDSDQDGLSDGGEVNLSKTDPLKADSDGDGLNDGLEVSTHHTNPLLTDSDSDSFDDKLEIDKGTNPLDAGSLPIAQLTVWPAIEIEFGSVAGENYQTQVSSDLKTWVNLGAPFAGTGQLVGRFIQAREQASFVRVAIVR